MMEAETADATCHNLKKETKKEEPVVLPTNVPRNLSPPFITVENTTANKIPTFTVMENVLIKFFSGFIYFLKRTVRLASCCGIGKRIGCFEKGVGKFRTRFKPVKNPA